VTEPESVQHLHAIIDNLIGLQDAQASYIAIYLSGIFAFLLASHSAKLKMTRFQVVISSLIFSLFACVISVWIIAFGAGTNVMLLDLAEVHDVANLGRYRVLDPSARPTIVVVVWSIGPIAALAFMWSVRHPKTA
jgi:hypothetical protein